MFEVVGKLKDHFYVRGLNLLRHNGLQLLLRIRIARFNLEVNDLFDTIDDSLFDIVADSCDESPP